MHKFLPIFAIVFCFISCDYFKQDSTKIPVARVNDNYLYAEDIRELVPANTPTEDSTLIVDNYINRWATQQLLIDQAKINLSPQKLETYDKMVSDYKNDLYTEAYKNSIVATQLDSTISSIEFQNFYEANKDNFILNDELLKVRYIHIDETFNNLPQTRERLNRFNSEDQEALSNISIQFRSYNFNDSIWVKKEVLFDALPVLTTLKPEVLKKSNFAQLQDSLGVYLVKIEDILRTNDLAPLSYVKPTIKQIVLNKRKLELIKKLEKDITKDAIKNKNFETYTNQ